MKKGIFIETKNYQRLLRAITQAEDAEKGMPGMVAAWGKSGLGKTMSAQKIYGERKGVYVRAFEGMTQHDFMQTLLYELAGERLHGVARNRARIMEKLHGDKQTVYIDEADRLDSRRLEDLRDIHDVTGAVMVLIGEEALPARISAKSRIDNRIPQAYRVAFETVSQEDVLLYAFESAGLTLDAEACKSILKHAHGSFREVHNAILLLEAAAKASARADVDKAMAKAILEAA